jgi:tetratricopeptide (TPR) repeat protein
LATPSKKRIATHLLALSLSITLTGAVMVSMPISTSAANQQAALLNNEGVKALNSGDFQTAIAKFEQALKLEPGYSFARDNLAIAYNNYALKQKSPLESMKYFHKALSISPGNTTTATNLDSVISSMGKNPNSYKDRLELGKQCRLASDFDGAIVEFQAALRAKNDAKLHVELGDVLRVRDRIDEAINEYKAALSAGGLEPTDLAKTNVKLGQAYQAKQNLPLAIAAFGEAIKYKSDDPDVLEALKTGWEEALRENPTAPENHIGLGQALEYAGDFGQAQAEYNQALTFDRNNRIAQQLLTQLNDKKRHFEIDKHINAGVDLQTQKQYDAALREYTIALKADPQNYIVFLNIGSCLQAKGDYDRAIAAYQRVLQSQPNNAESQQGIKACQDAKNDKQLADLTQSAKDAYTGGRYDEALKKYLELLDQTPKDAGVHFNAAASYQQLGRIDEALSEYKQAVALDPKNDEYKKYLDTAYDKKAQPIIDKAVAAHKQKDYRQAIDLYQQAIALRPKNTELYYDLAGALYSLQQYDQSRTAYNKALELDPKGQVNDLWFLGQIDENYGKGYDAIDKYRKYLAASPAGDFAKPVKERLDILLKNPNDTQKIKSEDELARIKDAGDAYQQAFKLQQDKQYDAAEQLYVKAMSLQPKESGYPYALATLHFAKGDLEGANSWIDKALAMDANNKDYAKYKTYLNEQRAEKMVDDAVAKQTSEDYKAAIGLYEQALQLAPKNARLWTNLASAYYAIDDFNDAYNAYKKAVDIDPKAEKLNFYSLGAIDENFNRGYQALDNYRKYIAASPDDKFVSDANDRIKILVANPGSTKRLPTHAEVKAGQAAQTAYDQGVQLQKDGKLDEAVDLYSKAMTYSPKEGAYPFAIGTVYQQKNDLENAAKFYQKAVDLSPNNAEFKKILATVKNGEAGPLVDEAAKKYSSGDYTGAITLYRQALQIIPNDPSVHTDLASCLQATDDFQGALPEYETAYKIDPKSQAEDLYFVAALKEHFNRGSEALTNYREYLTKNPSGKFKQYASDRVTALAKNVADVQHLQTQKERESTAQLQSAFDAAVKLQGDGKYAEADAQYAELMQKNPREAAYPYARGTNYQAQGDLPNAIAAYDKAASMDPSNADYKKASEGAKDLLAAQLVQKATEKFGAKDFPGALDQYKQALTYASRSSQGNIWTNIGIAYQYSDQWQQARDAYKKGFDLDPKGEVDNLYLMGPLDESLGKGQAAFDDYKNYLSYAPKGKYATDANARYQILYYDKTKLQKMQTSTDTANAQAANDDFNEAVKLQGDNKLDEALAKYQEALKANQNADSVWYSMGTAYQAKNDLDNAIKAYEKAASLNPKEPSYKKVLKDARSAKAAPLIEEAIRKQTAKEGVDLPGAIASYQAALKVDEDGNTTINLGTAYQANNMLDRALNSYLRALQLDNKLVDAHYYAATVYEQMNKKPQAIDEYKKYLQAAPTGQFATPVKERLKTLK